MEKKLRNYRLFIEKVDQLCEGISSFIGDALTCHEGCSSCCLSISVFPVEAAAIVQAVENLPCRQKRKIMERLASFQSYEKCPLLYEERCLIYEARPIICRTHGLPILVFENNERRIDICPKNFLKLHHLPGNAIIDIEKLNTALTAINALYLKETGSSLPERIQISALGDILGKN